MPFHLRLNTSSFCCEVFQYHSERIFQFLCPLINGWQFGIFPFHLYNFGSKLSITFFLFIIIIILGSQHQLNLFTSSHVGSKWFSIFYWNLIRLGALLNRRSPQLQLQSFWRYVAISFEKKRKKNIFFAKQVKLGKVVPRAHVNGCYQVLTRILNWI